MNDRFKFRIPMFTDKSNFQEFQYLELGEQEEYTLCGYNGEPQQCTDLKDKNGKLIYEGDIVKMPYIEPILNWMPSDNNTELAKIEEFKGCFTILYLDFSSRTYLYEWNEKIEVIGNIYENKELLESEG